MVLKIIKDYTNLMIIFAHAEEVHTPNPFLEYIPVVLVVMVIATVFVALRKFNNKR